MKFKRGDRVRRQYGTGLGTVLVQVRDRRGELFCVVDFDSLHEGTALVRSAYLVRVRDVGSGGFDSQ